MAGKPLKLICAISATFLKVHDFLYAVPVFWSNPENHDKIPCYIAPHMVLF